MTLIGAGVLPVWHITSTTAFTFVTESKEIEIYQKRLSCLLCCELTWAARAFGYPIFLHVPTIGIDGRRHNTSFGNLIAKLLSARTSHSEQEMVSSRNCHCFHEKQAALLQSTHFCP
jgi:hypothetical protein